LGDDGAACWVKGDRLALWAYGADAPAFEQVPFRFWYRKESPDKGMFVGMVDPMAAGTYTYYGAYPLPETAAGTKVTYTIPSVQNGAWNGQLDIMLAATQGAELQEEILNEVTLRFHHKVHVLKITVPQGRNRLGSPIERLHIEFPHPVTGRMTWDLTAPEAAPEMAATSNAVTLEFAEPIDEGDTFWVYLAPADLRGGGVRFTATDGTEFSWPLTTAGFDDCRAGVITPVNLTVAEARPQVDFRITVDPSHLGETVTQIDSLTMPAGYEFPALGRCRTLKTFIKNSDGTFTARIFNDQTFANGMQVGLGTASENTEGVYGKRCDVRDVTAAGCTIAAPYLFFEDFSETIPVSNYADENGGSAQEMTDAGLPGWTGSRWKTDQQSLEFRTYIGSSTIVGRQDNKYGRVDTPPLPLRSGRTVTLSVSYDIGSTNNSKCTFGWTTQSGPIAGGRGYDNRTPPENEVESFAPDASGSPTNMPTHKDYTIRNCVSGIRLSWFGTYNSGLVTAKTFYFYMDNVRVTIVQ
ncbi:MAG: fimbrillin family protein, partial [Alistipes sp.]|nr:fimbrillin family protein [Alistipes sp.]